MNDDIKPPSTSASPDLDWSQVRETVRMLHLSVAQIAMAMRDGDDSVTALTNSFTAMVGSTNMIAAAAKDLPDDEQGMKRTIEEQCVTVSGQMHEAIVAFQFYDKLSQRLGHVNKSLESLAELVSDAARLYSPYEWRGLQQQIRAQYSMQEEQEMFDALHAGSSIEEALQLLVRRREEAKAEDDIELF